jgi:cytochrome c-type biogenesis protein
MTELFTSLSSGLQGAWPLALAAAFVWGVLSIVLSPCHLASIPLIVAFIGGQGPGSTRRAAALASLFSVGILITIAVIGLATAAIGRMLGDVGRVGNWLVAVIFLLVGLHLLDVIPLPIGAARVSMKRRGAWAALLLGLIFGIALGPCTFAYLAPMLAVTLRAGSMSLLFGVLLLLAYGLGHTSVIALAGTFTQTVQRSLDWNERSRALIIVKKVCAVLILLAGLYLLYLGR